MTWYVVDGMDGSGKSTAGDLITKTLEEKGRRVMCVTHPNPGCFWGRIEQKTLRIDGKPAKVATIILYILDVLCSLFKERISRKKHDDVVFVRYIMAVSYLSDSGSKKAYKIISKILPMPDVKIFIDVDEKTAMERIITRGEEREAFEEEDKLRIVRARIMALAEMYDWYTVDNNGTPENTARQIAEIMDKEMES